MCSECVAGLSPPCTCVYWNQSEHPQQNSGLPQSGVRLLCTLRRQQTPVWATEPRSRE